MVRLCLFVRLSISVPLQLWLSLRFLRWRIRWCIWRRLSPQGLSSKVLSPGGLSSRVLARGRLSWWWLSRRWLSRRELSRRGWTPLRWASVTDTPTRHGATGQYAGPSEAEQMARNTAMAGWGLVRPHSDVVAIPDVHSAPGRRKRHDGLISRAGATRDFSETPSQQLARDMTAVTLFPNIELGLLPCRHWAPR